IQHLLRVWDARTGKALTADFGPLTSELVRALPRGGRVITQEQYADEFHVWDWTTGTRLFTSPLHGDIPEFAQPLPSSGDDSALWLSRDGGLARPAVPSHVGRWDAAAQRLLREFDPVPADLAPPNWKQISPPVPSPDGRYLSMLFARGKDLQTKCLFL